MGKNKPKIYFPQNWIIWFVSALFVFLQFGLQLSSGEILSGLMKSFSLTTFGAGLLTSSYYYIYVSLQTPVGLLMDFHGPRKLLSVGALMCCAGCFVFAQSTWVEFAALGRIMMGTGAAFAFVGSITLVSRWFPPEKFSFMLGIVEAIGMLSGLLMGVSVAHVVENFGWRASMWGAGLIAVSLSLLIWLIVRDFPKSISPHVSPTTFPWRDMKYILKNPCSWYNGLFSGMMFSLISTFSVLWSIPFFMHVYHFQLGTAALCGNFIFVGLVMGCPIVGWIDHRTHHRKILMPIYALAAGIFLSAIIYLPLSLVSILICMTLLGLFASSYILSFAIGHELATPSTKSAAIGFVNTLSVGLTPIFQPLIGYLLWVFSKNAHNDTHSYHLAFAVFPILLLIAALIARWIPERKNYSTSSRIRALRPLKSRK